jgi:hypothetical protein
MNTKLAFAFAILISSSVFGASGLRRSKSFQVLGLVHKDNRSVFSAIAETSSVEVQLACLRELLVTALVLNNGKQREFLLTQLNNLCVTHNIDFAEQVEQIQKEATKPLPKEAEEEAAEPSSEFEFDFEM